MFHTVFIHKIPVTQKQAKKLSFPALWNSFMVLGQRETVLACFSTMSAMRKIVGRFMTLGFHNAYLDLNIVLELACSKEAVYQNMTHKDRIPIPNDWQIWKYCAYLETSTNSKLVRLYWLTRTKLDSPFTQSKPALWRVMLLDPDMFKAISIRTGTCKTNTHLIWIYTFLESSTKNAIGICTPTWHHGIVYMA